MTDHANHDHKYIATTRRGTKQHLVSVDEAGFSQPRAACGVEVMGARKPEGLRQPRWWELRYGENLCRRCYWTAEGRVGQTEEVAG